MNRVPTAPVGRRVRGAAAFRRDRGRGRRRAFLALAAGLVFASCLAQIWLTTEVAEQGSRVNRLAAEVGLKKTALSISQAELSRHQTFARVRSAAELAGLASGGQVEEVALAPDPAAASGVLGQVAADIRRGSWLILTEAVAGDRAGEIAERDVER
jgi:hypothetical protein